MKHHCKQSLQNNQYFFLEGFVNELAVGHHLIL